jgi:hypothetical protein
VTVGSAHHQREPSPPTPSSALPITSWVKASVSGWKRAAGPSRESRWSSVPRPNDDPPTTSQARPTTFSAAAAACHFAVMLRFPQPKCYSLSNRPRNRRPPPAEKSLTCHGAFLERDAVRCGHLERPARRRNGCLRTRGPGPGCTWVNHSNASQPRIASLSASGSCLNACVAISGAPTSLVPRSRTVIQRP